MKESYSFKFIFINLFTLNLYDWRVLNISISLVNIYLDFILFYFYVQVSTWPSTNSGYNI